MTSFFNGFRKIQNSSGYLGKVAGFLLSYFRTFLACLQLKKEILVRHPGYLDPVTFTVTSIAFVTALFGNFWPESPLSYYSLGSQNFIVKLLPDLIPVPIATACILAFLISTLPFVIYALISKFRVRIERIFRCVLYVNSTGFVLLTIVYFSFLAISQNFTDIISPELAFLLT